MLTLQACLTVKGATCWQVKEALGNTLTSKATESDHQLHVYANTVDLESVFGWGTFHKKLRFGRIVLLHVCPLALSTARAKLLQVKNKALQSACILPFCDLDLNHQPELLVPCETTCSKCLIMRRLLAHCKALSVLASAAINYCQGWHINSCYCMQPAA